MSFVISSRGKLLLLPHRLDEESSLDLVFPPAVKLAVSSLQGLIAESEKTARRYLRLFLSHEEMAKMPLALLNEHTDKKEVHRLLDPILKGEVWGLISDAGLPCIADPGSDLVLLARQRNIPVETFVGPCSILLALQLSGFPGQRFAFHGYLPRETQELEVHIQSLEKAALQNTQIWIEAPYRTEKMVELLKNTLEPSTYLCVALNLTGPNQKVLSFPILEWRKRKDAFQKENAIFLIARFS